MIRLAVAGAAGRMGVRIITLASQGDAFKVVAAIERGDHEAIGQDVGEVCGLGRMGLDVSENAAAGFDVLIDFSRPACTEAILGLGLKAGRPLVIGTTGHEPQALKAIDDAARKIAIVKAANMSVGVNLLLKLAGQLARALGDEYDIEIVESHHRFKTDAPSGTALALRDAIVEATGRDVETDVLYGRHGEAGQRPTRQIGMHALRIGDTVGEHEIHFGNLGETLVLRHSAHTRDTFATGALRAAAWVIDKPAGKYDMWDVLGIES